MPGDRLALPVLIRGEVEGVGVLEGLLEVRDGLLLVGADDVVRIEPAVHVDPELAVRALLHLRGKVARHRDVTDVSHRCLNDVVVPQVSADGPRLRRGLDDHQMSSASHVDMSFLAATSSRPVRRGRMPWSGINRTHHLRSAIVHGTRSPGLLLCDDRRAQNEHQRHPGRRATRDQRGRGDGRMTSAARRPEDPGEQARESPARTRRRPTPASPAEAQQHGDDAGRRRRCAGRRAVGGGTRDPGRVAAPASAPGARRIPRQPVPRVQAVDREDQDGPAGDDRDRPDRRHWAGASPAPACRAWRRSVHITPAGARRARARPMPARRRSSRSRRAWCARRGTSSG